MTTAYRVTSNVALQGRVVRREAVVDRPKGTTRSKIHEI
jgi:hypothetical protein